MRKEGASSSKPIRTGVSAVFTLLSTVVVAVVVESAKGSWQLSRFETISYIVAFAAATFVFTMLLEAGVKVPGRRQWHIYRYLRDVTTTWDPHASWRRRFVPLYFGQGPRFVRAAHVTDKRGERRDLVTFLLENAKSGADRHQAGRQVLLLGEPGSGKTTALQRLTFELAASSLRRLGFRGPIPVFVRASEHQEGQDLKSLVRARISEFAKGATSRVMANDETIEMLLESDRLVVLVDALDEALETQRAKVLKTLREPLETARLADLTVYVTCRTMQDPGKELDGYETYKLVELTDDAVEQFIDAYSRHDQVSPDEVRQTLRAGRFLDPGMLGRNPFWLRQLIAVRTTESSRSGILKAASRSSLETELSKPASSARKWKRPPENEKDEYLEVSLKGLTALAKAMKLKREVSLNAISEKFQNLASGDSELGRVVGEPQDLFELGRDAGLLSRGVTTVSFSHRLIQEYFTAVAEVSDSQQFHDNLPKYIEDNTCWQMVAIAAGLLPEGGRDQLVGEILDGQSERHLACAVSVYVGDNQPTDTPVSDRLLPSVREALAAPRFSEDLRLSLEQFLTIGHDAAARFLSQLLADDESAVRRRVCTLLGKSEAPEAARMLAFIGLGDEDDTVADSAIEAIGNMKDRSSWLLTRQLYSPRPGIRERAAAALAINGAPEAVNYLLECNIPDDVAVAALARCGVNRVGRLLAAVELTFDFSARRAFKALTQIPDARVLEFLKRNVMTPNLYVRTDSPEVFNCLENWVEQFGEGFVDRQHGKSALVSVLVDILQNADVSDLPYFEREWYTRRDMVIERLAVLDPDGFSKTIVDWTQDNDQVYETEAVSFLLRHCQGRDAIRAAIELIGRHSLDLEFEQETLPGNSAIWFGEAQQLITSPEPGIRLAAVNVLRRSDNLDPAAREAVEGLLNSDREPDVRLAAFHTLISQSIPDANGTRYVETAFNDSDSEVRRAAVASDVFAKLDEDQHRNALTDGDASIRSAACTTLLRSSGQNVSHWLHNLAGDRANEVRCAVAAALAVRIEEETGPVLLKLARDESPEVRENSVPALANRQGAEFAETLRSMLGDPSEFVRTAAATALHESANREGLL